MPEPTRTQLTISAGAPMSSLLRSTIEQASIPPGEIVVAAPARSEMTADLRTALDGAGRRARLLTPSEGAGTFRSVIGEEWVRVDVADRASRLRHVRLPRSLVAGNPLIAMTDLRVNDPARPLVVIGLWARFAHPAQRLGALLSSRERDGLAPEIALAVRPALVLIGGVWSGGDLLISTADQIAAELAGRALGDLQADPGADRPGPWEHPLVQRATELDLGVRYPGAISLHAAWKGAEAEPSGPFTALVSRIGARMGVHLRD